jgi:hypothetical protein
MERPRLADLSVNGLMGRMQIHVARNAAQLGVFSAEEIQAGLQAGRFNSTDLAWREGMAGWTPLGDWPEFRASNVPISSGVVAVAPVASAIPWEQGKSIGSFFATIKVVLSNPSVLSTGRYAFGDWLLFCYLAVLFALPFQIVHIMIAGDPNVALAELLKGLHNPQIQKAVEQLQQKPASSSGLTVVTTIGAMIFAPFLYAFCALVHWVGQRIFRLQVSVERTVSAALLATGSLILLTAPLQLLGFSMTVQLVVSFLLFVPVCVIYFRAFGSATGVNPWVQFGISAFVWFILCCCCCIIPAGGLIGGMAAAGGR